MMISSIRTADAARVGEVEMRAEAIVLQVEGEGRGVERINRFYREAAKLWLARCTGTLSARLPSGRYHARMSFSAEEGEDELLVQLCMTLCLRGRSIEERRETQHWLLPHGWLLGRPSCKRMKSTAEKRCKKTDR